MQRFTGIMITVPDGKGGEKCTYVGKSRKGLLRAHRKGRCDAFCGCCYAEACEGADFTPRGGWWHRGRGFWRRKAAQLSAGQ